MRFNNRDLYFNKNTPLEQSKELVGVELGEQWTYQGMTQQGVYLAQYTKSPKRQAAWLLGLSACIADDESTLPRMKEALASGLPVEHAVAAAIASNSRAGAQALSQLGVDWSTQLVVPTQSRWANDDKNIDQPNQALIESFIEPERGGQRFRMDVVPHNALDEAIFHGATHFMEGVLESSVGASLEIQTPALGLATGRAKLLSLLIINRHWDLANSMIDEDPDTLDEALLACAMCAFLEFPQEDRLRQGYLALDLIEKGANPDRIYEFGLEAALGFENSYASPLDYKKGVGLLTARQWAISGALVNEQDGVRAMEQAFMTKLPAAPISTGQWSDDNMALPPSWLQWAMCMTRSSRDWPGSASTDTLRILIDSQPPTQEEMAWLLDVSLSHASHDGWKAFDALTHSQGFPLVKGTMDRPTIANIIMKACEGNPLGPRVKKELWFNPRLEKLVQLMPEEDVKLWEASSENWLRALRNDQPVKVEDDDVFRPTKRRTPQEEEVIALTFKSSMEAFTSRSAAVPRPRRSL